MNSFIPYTADQVKVTVTVGYPPWQPSPDAEMVDVWDKYDFPLNGTYRLGDEVILFRLAGIEGDRSRWEYVRAVPGGPEGIAGLRNFDTPAEFDAWMDGCFTGKESVTAEAQDFVITAVQMTAGPAFTPRKS